MSDAHVSAEHAGSSGQKPAALSGSVEAVLSEASVPVRSLEAEKQLEQAMDDAALLLAFAVQSQRSPKSEVIQELNRSLGQLKTARADEREWSADERTAFWSAYDDLATTVAPVSAFSIRETTRLHQLKGFRLFRSPTFGLGLVAVGVFVVTVVMQAFWVTGRELLDDANRLAKRKSEVTEQLWKLQDENQRLRGDLQREWCRLVQEENEKRRSKQKTTDTRSSLNSSDAETPSCDPLEDAQDRFVPSLQPLQALIHQADRQIRAAGRDEQNIARGIKELEPALFAWYGFCPAKVCTDIANSKYGKALHEIEESLKQLVEKRKVATASRLQAISTTDGIDKRVADSRSLAQSLSDFLRERRDLEQRKLELQAAQVRDLVQRVRMLLAGLERYAIPMLMGVLGALTFMLRSMVTQLRDYTYTPIFASVSLIRICLGGIAGVFGGFFVSAEEPGVRALPPVVIPFVLGYGIEIVFAGLDRVVKTFTMASDKGGP